MTTEVMREIAVTYYAVPACEVILYFTQKWKGCGCWLFQLRLGRCAMFVSVLKLIMLSFTCWFSHFIVQRFLRFIQHR